MVKNWLSEFKLQKFSTKTLEELSEWPTRTSLFGENCWKKFIMPIFGCSKLYQSFWEKLLEKIQNGHFWLFQIFSDNFSVHIAFIECNGLENNELCTFLDFYSEI